MNNWGSVKAGNFLTFVGRVCAIKLFVRSNIASGHARVQRTVWKLSASSRYSCTRCYRKVQGHVTSVLSPTQSQWQPVIGLNGATAREFSSLQIQDSLFQNLQTSGCEDEREGFRTDTDIVLNCLATGGHLTLYSTVVTICTACFNTAKHSIHRVYLCVPYGSHNKQRLFPQTALTGWAL
jgi:hypothetical protein